MNKYILFFWPLLCCAACTQPEGKDVSRGIVSLSPSITREIIDLGAEDLLIGVTSYHPPLSKKVESVGSLNLPNIEKVLLLKPEIVLFSEEDAATQRLEAFASASLRLYGFSRNQDFYAICANYIKLGKIIGKDSEAKSKAAFYTKELSELKRSGRKISLLMLVSHEPLITVSNMSFIGQIINDAGAKNIFADAALPYPIISTESIVRRAPDAVVVMTDGGLEYFQKKFGYFSIPALQKGNLFKIEPEHTAYYTPLDYVAAVKDFIVILDSAKL